ncbi:MAG: hypothetical protein GX589_05905 [Deltaproteobacteria bacterium]|nr:hypothetical protein [Deltaproteobacteria bacterium]
MVHFEDYGNLARKSDPEPGWVRRKLYAVVSAKAPPAERRYRYLLRTFVVIFFLLLALPLAQIYLHPFPKATVPHGLHPPPSKPRFTWQGFFNERFQRKFEGWFSKGNGLWGHFVRASNQINYSLFNQVSTHYSSTILAGNKGYFFQPMYLPSFNRIKQKRHRNFVKPVRTLRRFQDLLAERGKTVVSLISTNMLALYPDVVPSYYTDPTRLSRKNVYEIIRPLYDEYGINYVDGHEQLSALVPSADLRFFEPTASHWNSVGSCLVTSRLVDRIAELMGKKLVNFACEPYILSYPPRGWDLDLVRIANLVFPERTYVPAPYVEPRTLASGGEYKPKILFVGSSFLFAVLTHLEKHEVTDHFTYYFYYRQVRDSEHRRFRTLRRDKINWERDIFSHDVIVFERNMASIHDMGFSFVKDAIRELRKAKKNGAQRDAASVVGRRQLVGSALF